jgi:hypothetical protein
LEHVTERPPAAQSSVIAGEPAVDWVALPLNLAALPFAFFRTHQAHSGSFAQEQARRSRDMLFAFFPHMSEQEESA